MGSSVEDPGRLCWSLAFLVGQLLYLSAEQVSVNHNSSRCMSANNSLCFAFFFLASSIQLSFAGLGGVKQKGDLRTLPGEAGEVDCSPRSSFSGERNSLGLVSFFFQLNSAGLFDGMMQTE